VGALEAGLPRITGDRGVPREALGRQSTRRALLANVENIEP
jgi:hypothetical protein